MCPSEYGEFVTTRQPNTSVRGVPPLVANSDYWSHTASRVATGIVARRRAGFGNYS